VSLALYRLVTTMAMPLVRPYLMRRARRGKEDQSRLDERFGIASRARPSGRVVWIHAASVGESLSMLSVVERLVAERPSLTVLMTTGTVTSARLMAERLPDRAIHQYAPVDGAPWVRRFLDHWRPDLALCAPTEVELGSGRRVIVELDAGGVGAALVGRLEARGVDVLAVEPEGSAAYHRALAADGPVDVEIDSIASDSLGARSIGAVPWSVLQQHPPVSLLVSDDAIRAAQRWLWTQLKLVVEPGGAAAFAAVLDGTHTPSKDGSTVIVVCGANADPASVTG